MIENNDWKLGCFMEWRPKHHAIACPFCNGRGEVGGGFKDLDGSQTCPECFGTKIKSEGPSTEMPELPKELVEHMRRAWWDFTNAKSQPQKMPCLPAIDEVKQNITHATVRFNDLPLGARFSYIGGNDVWVVLGRHDCGLIAKWDGDILKFAGQTVCPAAGSPEEVNELQVVVSKDK